MSKTRIDRFKLFVEDEKTGKEELSIDIPTYFKIDTGSLWEAVMKELTKQEKKAIQLSIDKH